MRTLSNYAVAVSLSLCLVVVACGSALEAPPVKVTYRDSLVGIGKILQITNASQELVENLELRIENPNGDVKNHSIPALGAGLAIEVGWKKLDGFEVAEGASVSLRAEGYGLPFQAELTASPAE